MNNNGANPINLNALSGLNGNNGLIFNSLNGIPVPNPLNSMNINMQMNMNMNLGNASLLNNMGGGVYQGLNNANAGGVVPSTKSHNGGGGNNNI